MEDGCKIDDIGRINFSSYEQLGRIMLRRRFRIMLVMSVVGK